MIYGLLQVISPLFIIKILQFIYFIAIFPNSCFKILQFIYFIAIFHNP